MAKAYECQSCGHISGWSAVCYRCRKPNQKLIADTEEIEKQLKLIEKQKKQIIQLKSKLKGKVTK